MAEGNYRQSFALITVAGNIGKSAEVKTVKYKDTTAQVARFSLCQSSGKTADQKGFEQWFTVSIWEAEKGLMALVPKLIVGRNVRVYGRFRLSVWKDKDGKEQKTPTIAADDISFYVPPDSGSRNYYRGK